MANKENKQRIATATEYSLLDKKTNEEIQRELKMILVVKKIKEYR